MLLKSRDNKKHVRCQYCVQSDPKVTLTNQQQTNRTKHDNKMYLIKRSTYVVILSDKLRRG